ncbi:MAG TPA: BON domain-containing protein [Fimbriimonas sp.]
MKLLTILEGLAVGAGLMYVLDPESGRRRRAMARDQFQKQVRHRQSALGVMQRDFANRSRGMMTQFKAARTHGDMVADDIVEQRIRSALGRVCSHPRAIYCQVHNGEATLTGQVLNSNVQKVVQCVKNTKGVHRVVNRLDVHEDASGISSLQGESRLSRATTWTPATGLVMSSLGGLMTLYGMARRGPVGTIIGGLGVGMISKAFRDTENRFMPTHPQRTLGNNQEHARSQEADDASYAGYEGLNATETYEADQEPMPVQVADDENSGLI